MYALPGQLCFRSTGMTAVDARSTWGGGRQDLDQGIWEWSEQAMDHCSELVTSVIRDPRPRKLKQLNRDLA